MADGAPAERRYPLSPHLQIYRWHLTMAISIGHRVTGCALACGLFLLTWWLAALASGPEYFGIVQAIMDNFFGVLILIGYTFALFFHAANGIRHLYWDTGRGLELESAHQSAVMVVGAAAGLTVLTWLLIFLIG